MGRRDAEAGRRPSAGVRCGAVAALDLAAELARAPAELCEPLTAWCAESGAAPAPCSLETSTRSTRCQPAALWLRPEPGPGTADVLETAARAADSERCLRSVSRWPRTSSFSSASSAASHCAGVLAADSKSAALEAAAASALARTGPEQRRACCRGIALDDAWAPDAGTGSMFSAASAEKLMECRLLICRGVRGEAPQADSARCSSNLRHMRSSRCLCHSWPLSYMWQPWLALPKSWSTLQRSPEPGARRCNSITSCSSSALLMRLCRSASSSSRCLQDNCRSNSSLARSGVTALGVRELLGVPGRLADDKAGRKVHWLTSFWIATSRSSCSRRRFLASHASPRS